MTGDGINAIARRIVSRATHRTVVLPALADLQFEARTRSPWCLAQSYTGAWMAVAGGVLQDIGVAVQRPGWIDDARTVVWLVAMQMAYYGFMLSVAVANSVGSITSLDLVRITLVVGAISSVPVIALVLPKRHARDR